MSWKQFIFSHSPAWLMRYYTLLRTHQQHRQIRKGLLQQYGHYAEYLLPQRRLSDLFPEHVHVMVQIPMGQIVRDNVIEMPLPELLSLAALTQALQPQQVFEFGTYIGASTMAIAQNSSADTHIYTLDLDPDIHAQYLQNAGYNRRFVFRPGERFQGKPEQKKITQLYVGSDSFDFSPYYGKMDFIFIDANHSYDYVKADTLAAFKMLKAGGVIVWDDYVWKEENAECVGVTRYLNELADTKPIYRIAQTRLGIYVDPVAGTPHSALHRHR